MNIIEVVMRWRFDVAAGAAAAVGPVVCGYRKGITMLMPIQNEHHFASTYSAVLVKGHVRVARAKGKGLEEKWFH